MCFGIVMGAKIETRMKSTSNSSKPIGISCLMISKYPTPSLSPPQPHSTFDSSFLCRSATNFNQPPLPHKSATTKTSRSATKPPQPPKPSDLHCPLEPYLTHRSTTTTSSFVLLHQIIIFGYNNDGARRRLRLGLHQAASIG